MIKNIIAETIKVLQSRNISLGRIVLQKYLYYLKIHGVPFKAKYSAYTHGPYSFRLARELGDMVFWDELAENGNEYTVKDLSAYTVDDELKVKISELVDSFARLTNNDCSFHKMELYGTVLYCRQVLKNANEEITETKVVEEFQKWKKGKGYKNKEIVKAYKGLSQ